MVHGRDLDIILNNIFVYSVIFIGLLAYQVSALAQDDSEPRAAPARGLLKRGLLAKGKATTTTTTPAPQVMKNLKE